MHALATSNLPGKHASQVVWPAVEADPTSHGLQGVAGLESWSAKPARQSAHVVAVALAPGWQVAHAVAELESSSYVLAPHALQSSPSISDPAGQPTQAARLVAPTAEYCLSAGHCSQALAPGVSAYRPDAHNSHGVHALASSSERPAGHGVHSTAPALRYEPALQAPSVQRSALRSGPSPRMRKWSNHASSML